MKYFFSCVVAFFLIFAACSGTETVQKEKELSEPIEEKSSIPVWYNSGIHSSSDSLSIHGYALASAMDSSNAVELSTQTALEYLRFEIDRTAEEVRKELVDSSQMRKNYSSAAFIIQLRNAVSALALDSATIALQHESSEKGVHYSYAKASISRTDLSSFLENSLNDEVFLEGLKTLDK